MKKWLIVVVCFTILALLLGCPPKPTPTPAPAPPTPTPVAPVPVESVKITWKAQGFVPAGLIFHETLLRFASDLKELSGGRLELIVHPAGALVHPFEAIEAVNKGVFEFNYGYTGQWIGKIPVSPLFTATPGIMATPLSRFMWIEYGGGKELWKEMYERYGYKDIVAFPSFAIPMEIFVWAKKPLKTVEDFKGIKMRMMPLMGDVLAKKGFSVVFLPAGEILPALEKGIIDAAEYSIPVIDLGLGFGAVAKYYHYPGIHQPSSQGEILVNKKAWDALPADLKEIFKRAVVLHQQDALLFVENANLKALAEFDKRGYVKVVMDPKTVETFIKWACEYFDELAAKDPFFAKVWESQKAWEKKWAPYEKALTW